MLTQTQIRNLCLSLVYGVALTILVLAVPATISTAAIPSHQYMIYVTGIKQAQPPDRVEAGQPLTYTLTFSSDIAGTLVVSDPLPVYVDYRPGSIMGTVMTSTNLITPGGLISNTLIWTVTNVVTESNITLSFGVTVTEPLTSGLPIQNVAYVNGVASLTKVVTVTSQLTTTLLKQADPASGSMLNVGDMIVYTLQLSSTGNALLPAVVTDSLPITYTELVTSYSAVGSITATNNLLTWTLDALSPGIVTATVQVKVVDGPSIAGDTILITNTFALSHSGQLTQSNAVTHRIAAAPAYLPAIIKAPPPPVLPVFQNAGFEAGNDGSWDLSSTQFTEDDLIVEGAQLNGSVVPDGGNRMVWLGGRPDEVATIAQTVAISAGYTASNPLVMTYRYLHASLESNLNEDIAQLRINGNPERNFALNSSNDTRVWVSGCQDVTNLLSATEDVELTVSFYLDLDGNNNSNLFLDNMAFVNGTCPAGTASSSTAAGSSNAAAER